VEAIHLAGQYSSKKWAFVITPTNRRPYGFDWQDWGRLDFEEVFEEVMKEYPIDPDRVYLAGSSMGGQGAWHIGLHYPSWFAALAPQAGWTGFQHYSPFTMQKSQMFAAPDLLNVRNRVMQDSNNLYFLKNFRHLPVVITHGVQDRIVPPLHPRMFQKFLKERDFMVNYRELPEKGHWWDDPRSSGEGSDAVDNEEVLDFLRQQARNRYPQQFNIRLFDLSINDTFYWVRVLSQQETLQQTLISAEVIGEEVLLNTENVLAMEVDWGALNLPIQRIIWNQQQYSISDDSPMLLGPEPDGAAQLVTEYPALKSVFFRPFVLVYGTQGETHQQEMLLHQANQIAIRFWRSANGYVRVMADTEVTKSIESDFNLVMLGNPESNLMIKKLLPHTPLEFTENELRLEGKEYFGELAVSIMYPHPQFPERMMALFSGTTAEVERWNLHFLPIYSGSGTPHFIVFDKTVRQSGWGVCAQR
jgi:pimeloyl-ACP methyl ester carboxylesterase